LVPEPKRRGLLAVKRVFGLSGIAQVVPVSWLAAPAMLIGVTFLVLSPIPDVVSLRSYTVPQVNVGLRWNWLIRRYARRGGRERPIPCHNAAGQ
jgi:hypothetical protein